ncbi:hypothetical protein [Hoyosella altamirensis]|uniref:DUF3168 domain-containing protein n=1 Tax=Hoyosella altamirensis TaxID=616997 RepID=A0A839RV08_9ACTN|nr:hypothetical protein [Hoyosella altamirensis]MBB3040147.1 hypothetical protein [Hoyosella altamirensis]
MTQPTTVAGLIVARIAELPGVDCELEMSYPTEANVPVVGVTPLPAQILAQPYGAPFSIDQLDFDIDVYHADLGQVHALGQTLRDHLRTWIPGPGLTVDAVPDFTKRPYPNEKLRRVGAIMSIISMPS